MDIRNPYRDYRSDELERDAIAYQNAIRKAERLPESDTTALRANLCDIVAELDRRKAEPQQDAGQDVGDTLKVRGRTLFMGGVLGRVHGSGV